MVQTDASGSSRNELTDAYSVQLTDEAVQALSRGLNKYGASPIGAAIVKSLAPPDQSPYVVKPIVPPGDAAAILFGFNLDDKITGVSIVSMAGD